MTIKDRFLAKVTVTPTCWIWHGCISRRSGYGRFSLNGKVVNAHRASWFIFKSELSALFVCHSCDNRKCVNPDHLWLGNNQDNMTDMVNKGRQNKPRGSANGKSLLTEEDILNIRQDYITIKSTRKLAKKYNTTRSNIQFIIHRVSWRHV